MKVYPVIMLLSAVIALSSCGSSVEEIDKSSQSSADTAANSMATEIPDSSELRCPYCAFNKMEKLPDDVCLITYVCDSCQATIHPKEGDCCVFCSYGDVKCPSMQE